MLYGDIYIEHGPLQNSKGIKLKHGICLINENQSILSNWVSSNNTVFVRPKVEENMVDPEHDITGDKYLAEVRCAESHNRCHKNCDQSLGCYGPTAS